MTTVRSISIQAFRAFLEPRTLPMCGGKRPMSLCVYGENGTGKSSIGDAIEFFFAPDGLIERFGRNLTENKAGAAAMVHAKAAERKLRPQVSFVLSDDTTVERSVSVTGKPSVMPAEVATITANAPVPRLLRSWEMKTFVADETGAKRYEILARWVGLERLTALQDALRTLEGKIDKAKWSEPTSRKVAQDEAIAARTGKAVKAWDVAALIRWVNSELAAKSGIKIKPVKMLEDLERVAKDLLAAQSDDRLRVSIEGYQAVLDALDELAGADTSIEDFLNKATAWAVAAAEHEVLRQKNTASDFHDVWTAARKVLHEHAGAGCPVCERPFDENVSKSLVLARLDQSLAALKALADAEKHARALKETAAKAATGLDVRLNSAMKAIDRAGDDSLSDLRDAIGSLRGKAEKQKAAEEWRREIEDASNVYRTSASAARQHCANRVAVLTTKLAAPFGELLESVNGLIQIRDLWNRADCQERSLIRVREQYKMVADAIRAEVRAHLKGIIEQLQADVRTIYGALRGNDDHIPVVDIVVPDDRKSMNVTTSLYGISDAPPSGYLSDSQLNSLGLALFLAAIRRFNPPFPFLVLDDVMSSYDASHRVHLVSVVRKFLAGHQVVLTTHDEVFFREMKSMLASSGDWHFMRLKPWALEPGVCIDGDVSDDDDIESRLSGDEKPEVLAGLMMLSIEKWLCKVCDARRALAKLPIKKDGSPGLATMSDLWSAVQSKLDDVERAHPSYAIVSGHGILNWPRHAGTASDLVLTRGELKAFWSHFKAFRDSVV